MLDDKQKYVVERVNEGDNFCLLGQGGTGKSRTLNHVVDNKTIKCAPTGIAALNIGGITAHKLFGLPVGPVKDEDYFSISKTGERLFSGTEAYKVILDEAAMLRADFLDMIDSKLRNLRRNNLPFGGIQMVLSGDFYQLEPIVDKQNRRSFYKKYNSPFCFESDSWCFDVEELTTVYRQNNPEQVELLDHIRRKSRYAEECLEELYKNSSEYNPTETTLHLCCYKTDAEKINRKWYNKIKGQERTYLSVSDGKEWNESEKIVPDILKLKVGCRVLIKANHKEGEYVNGDKGTIVDLSPIGVVVRLDNGKEVFVEPYKWDKFNYENKNGKLEKVIESSYTQIPLLLGYGVSIHNIQGMTLTDAAIDFGAGCFSHGQAYVALSRITDLNNLSFVNEPSIEDIIVNREVDRFYKRLRRGQL